MTPEQIAWICGIAVIVGTLVRGIRYIWREYFPSSDWRRSIGTEAIDYNAFNASMRATSLNSGPNNMTQDHVRRPQAPRPKSYNEKLSAENLVKGIVSHNHLVLFVRNLNELDTTSPDAKAHTLLQEFGIAFKTVDVSKDPTMHLAFPEDGTEISLPMVYAHGKKIGSYDTIKKMHQDGTLGAIFSK